MLLKYLNSNYNTEDNLIFCGDFNSVPNSNQLALILDNQGPENDRTEEQFRKFVDF